MKTILLLTDLTSKGDHAAHYALRLACVLKVNLMLCNVYPETTVAIASNGLWAQSNDVFEQDSVTRLSALAGRLNKQLNKLTDDQFRPAIEQYSTQGPLVMAINNIVAERQIFFAVIASHHTGDFLDFLNGNHAHEIIDGAHCPVLVLPYQAPFNGFGKIAFATDLANNHNDVLHCIYNMANHFDAELLIAHIGAEKLGKVTEEYTINRFMPKEIALPDRSKVQYKLVQNQSVVNGIDWLAEYTDIDLLVLVHRKRHFLGKVFGNSVTKKLADHLTKPMLVFPDSYERGGVMIN